MMSKLAAELKDNSNFPLQIWKTLDWKILTFSPLELHIYNIENQKLSIINLNIALGCQVSGSLEKQPQNLFNGGFCC